MNLIYTLNKKRITSYQLWQTGVSMDKPKIRIWISLWTCQAGQGSKMWEEWGEYSFTLVAGTWMFGILYVF